MQDKIDDGAELADQFLVPIGVRLSSLGSCAFMQIQEQASMAYIPLLPQLSFIDHYTMTTVSGGGQCT